MASAFASECRRQRRARTLRPHFCLATSSSRKRAPSVSAPRGGSAAEHNHIAGASVVSATSTLPIRVPQAETSTHLESFCASASHRRAAASLLHQCRSFVVNSLQNTLQVPQWCWRQALSQSECRRQRRARILSHSAPSPRTVEQPQACSISVGASWRLCYVLQSHCIASVVSATSTLPIRVPQAETSTHLKSFCASASHRRAAASLLHQTELHDGFFAKATTLPAGA